MDEKKILIGFFERIKNDAVIDARHIALYMILFKRWLINGANKPILVKGEDVMKEAKISSSATYFLKLHYLSEKGYIEYEASYYSKHKSKISLKYIEK